MSPPDRGAASRGGGATVLFVVWPEYGHVVTPLALAKQLAQSGYRVVFAGARTVAPALRALGYDYADLSLPGAPGESTLFDFLPSRAAFSRAVDRLIVTLSEALRCYRPALVLFDSLYSAFGAIASAARVPWALYETDLPREHDPWVPPPHSLLPPARASRELIAREWELALSRIREVRASARGRAELAFAWATPYFPALLTEALGARLQSSVRFDDDTLYAPVARVARMVFCPRELDFERAQARDLTWVGPCIDFERREPDFPWHAVPPERPLAYCAFGTQSARHDNAQGLLQAVIDVLSAREDYFTVVACGDHPGSSLRAPSDRVLLVRRAPQLALLARASVAFTHAGFNSLKECAALGVPMVALPLGFDQPRNAALVVERGLGAALDVSQLSPAQLEEALEEATAEPVRCACARMRAICRAWSERPLALEFVEQRMAEGADAGKVARSAALPAERGGALGSVLPCETPWLARTSSSTCTSRT